MTAVDHVDLTVERGDVFGYLGPNGAGKTTSLRMLLGLIRPTAGSIGLFGRDPLEQGARALDGVAGFVEAPRFYPYLSGRRNLRLLADYDEPRTRARIEEVLELVELRDRGNDRVGGYSHGMKQRLGIAASLLRAPRLLLLDEPTTGLDPAGMRDMRSSSAASPARESPSCSPATCSPRSRTSATASRSSAAGRSSTKGPLAELKERAGKTWRLRTTDCERARTIALADGADRARRRRTASFTSRPPRRSSPRDDRARPGASGDHRPASRRGYARRACSSS